MPILRLAQGSVVLVLGFCLLACRRDANVPGDGFPIIDVHTHTHFTGERERTSGILVTQAQYGAALQNAGVVAAVSHGKGDGTKESHQRSLGVVHCAGVRDDPEKMVPTIAAGLEAKRYGCIKIYLGYVHRYAADPAYEPLYQLAQRFDVPVVFHTGDTYSERGKLKYAHPLTIDEVAVDHPKVRFVLAHCGNPWIESAAEVAYKNPNVYLDGSALLIGDLDRLPRHQVDTYLVRPLSWLFGYIEDPSKLMFGSDWPLVDIKKYAAAFRRAIPRKYWRAVFHDNALRVFPIDKMRPGVTSPAK